MSLLAMIFNVDGTLVDSNYAHPRLEIARVHDLIERQISSDDSDGDLSGAVAIYDGPANTLAHHATWIWR